MSYYPPQGGPPQPPYQQQSYPSQPQGASYPPHSNYQQQPPPMQSQYGGQGYGQPPYQQHGHPGYPPQQQPYGQPPPHQGYGHPPQGPPPGQAPYGQQHGAPPGPPPGQYGQQQQYGAPPGGHYHSGPPNPPSMGYVPGQAAPVDMSREADAVRGAMKGFGTDEKTLIAVLSRLDPLQVAGLKQQYSMRHRRELVTDLEKETSGYFRDGLVAIARGPLEQDVFNLNKAIAGMGTKEKVLNDVLLGRSNADLNAIKGLYQHTYRRSLEADVQGDLSAKTERLFNMVLAAHRAEDSAPVMPQQTDADVDNLYRATEGQKMGTDQIMVCSILSSRSDGQIRAISQAYQRKYHRALSEVIKKAFSGHMEDALLFMLSAAEDRAKHDAELLEDSMKGMGTKDDLLVNRVVRIHWDRARIQQAKAAYKHFYKKDLTARIKGETRGDYERLMVACCEIA